MGNKSKYRNLCAVEKNIPIFSQDWWLDAVCGEENWDVIIIEKGGIILHRQLDILMSLRIYLI